MLIDYVQGDLFDLDTASDLPLMGLPAGTVRPAPFLTVACGWRPDVRLPRRPVLLDLCCGEGGAALGYYAAGFHVVGVDKNPQPNYPFEFHQGNAVEFVTEYGHLFDAAHGSPPCQGESNLAPLVTGDYPDLIAPLRAALVSAGVPYVIENVGGARDNLIDPITLCMSTWARRSYRHRLFESNINLVEPPHFEHTMPQAKLGRPAGAGEAFQAMGHFPQIDMVRHQMEMRWASQRGIAESIPPVFTDYIGRQLIARLIDREHLHRLTQGD
jgi:DNA (cytosine-5)-methyltransferase 1